VSGDWEDWLALLRTPGVGPVTWGRLMGRFGSPEGVRAAGREAQRAAGLSEAACEWLLRPDPQVIAADLAWVEDTGHHLIPLGHPDYPRLLARIPDPPPLLFAIGDPTLLGQPQLAIVGSRSPTRAGLENARDFARHLAGAGLTITSGLAVGIDAAAHEGALSSGTTIAVLGTGPERVYPATNRDLAHRIAAGGALVTELPLGTPLRRESFPRRNRIISGLCLGTLVVEAASRSGSLITARLAAEQGREVLAIPGSIHSPLARGCHALIREGAKLVETAQDIVEELGTLAAALLPAPEQQPPASLGERHLDPDYRALLECLGDGPMAADTLCRCSGLPAAMVSSMLLMLELDGYVAPVPGGRYCRTAKREAAGK
jgi:DNA processing protein